MQRRGPVKSNRQPCALVLPVRVGTRLSRESLQRPEPKQADAIGGKQEGAHLRANDSLSSLALDPAQSPTEVV